METIKNLCQQHLTYSPDLQSGLTNRCICNAIEIIILEIENTHSPDLQSGFISESICNAKNSYKFENKFNIK